MPTRSCWGRGRCSRPCWPPRSWTGYAKPSPTARGRVVYVCNLRAEGTETFGYDVADHVAALRRHGVEPDVVVTHAGGLPLGDLAGLGAAPGIELVQADVARPAAWPTTAPSWHECLAEQVL